MLCVYGIYVGSHLIIKTSMLTLVIPSLVFIERCIRRMGKWEKGFWAAAWLSPG